MQKFMRPQRLSVDEVEVRPATSSDRSILDDLTENNRHAHFNLDWWSFDDWLRPDRSHDALWIAEHDHEPIGMVAIPIDHSPSVWIRGAAVADHYEPLSIFAALIDHALPRLQSSGVQQVASIGYPDWYADLLKDTQFTQLVQVISMRKDDRALPDLRLEPNVIIRPARSIDVPTIVANDRAAFDEVWWYSDRSIAHVLPLVAHFVVLELDGQIVGHAFSDVYGGQGHLIRLAVHPNFQGRGLGEKLLIESLRYQIEAGAYPLTVNTQSDNLASQKLYKRLGYRSIGVPVRVMKKSV